MTTINKKPIHYALIGHGKTSCGIRYYTGHEDWIAYSRKEVTCKNCLKYLHADRIKNFLKEFKALEKKYGARVSYRMEGDTYGITDSALTVQFLEPLKEGNRFRGWSEPVDIEEE